MTALLWLLLLAGGGALLPSLYNQTGKQHVLLAPLLLALGYGLSPAALGFVTTSAVREMQPALQMTVTWLAFAAGLQVPKMRIWQRHSNVLAKQLMTNVLATAWAGLGVGIVLVAAQLCFTDSHTWRMPEILQNPATNSLMWGWGCLVAGTQRRMRPADHVLIACLGLVLLCSFEKNMLGWTALMAVGCAGIIGLLSSSANAVCRKSLSWPIQTATLIGATSLTCGLAVQLGLPGVLVGFIVGACLKWTGLVLANQCRQVSSSVGSVHVVTLVLVGLSLRVSPAQIPWGIALGMVLMCMRLVWEYSRQGMRSRGQPIGSLVREDNAGRCIWLVASLLFITHRSTLAQALLPITAIAVILSDVCLWGAAPLFAATPFAKTCVERGEPQSVLGGHTNVPVQAKSSQKQQV